MSLHSFLGSLKTPIVKVGMACSTAFIITSFPACEMKLFFQLVTFFHILSLRFLKVLSFALPTIAGRPKYFSYVPQTMELPASFIAFFSSAFVFLLKKNEVLSLLRN
ncbi:hypothetical protein I3760_03G114200 [Carya illinoinensis]|nr:hypothetical protein I3760_03G114200 [Carya illinoinensis]